MGDSISIDFHVESHTDELINAVTDRIPTIMKSIGEEIEGYAKEDCPVDTGLLRNSITYALDGEAPNITEYSADRPRSAGGEVQRGSYGGAVPKEPNPDSASVYVGSNVSYAETVEMHDMAHKVGKAHFIRDAFQDHREEIKDLLETFFRSMM